MAEGTPQQLFNLRNSINYGVGQAGIGGGMTAEVEGTYELFVNETLTLTQTLGSGLTAYTSGRWTQGCTRFRGYVYADQTYNIDVDVSLDGVTWRTVPDTPATGFYIAGTAAGRYNVIDVPAIAPYMRLAIQNSSGSAMSILECVTDLIAGS